LSSVVEAAVLYKDAIAYLSMKRAFYLKDHAVRLTNVVDLSDLSTKFAEAGSSFFLRIFLLFAALGDRSVFRTGSCGLIPVQWRSEIALNGRWNKNLLKSGWNHVYPLGLDAYRSINMIKTGLQKMKVRDKSKSTKSQNSIIRPTIASKMKRMMLNKKVVCCEDVYELRYRVVCILIVWLSGFFKHEKSAGKLPNRASTS